MTKLKNSKCDLTKKTQMVTILKLKLWQDSKTQIVTKLKKSNCDKIKKNFNCGSSIIDGSDSSTLPARYTDRVDLKEGLQNNGVCSVKFFGVESYFLCNTTHTDQAIKSNDPRGLVISILWDGTSLHKSCCSEVQPNSQHLV